MAKPDPKKLTLFRVHFLKNGVLDTRDVSAVSPDAARTMVTGNPADPAIRVLKVKVVK